MKFRKHAILVIDSYFKYSAFERGTICQREGIRIWYLFREKMVYKSKGEGVERWAEPPPINNC